jgi:hypothetical protein
MVLDIGLIFSLRIVITNICKLFWVRLGMQFFFFIFKIATIEEIYFLKLSFDGLENLIQNRKKS